MQAIKKIITFSLLIFSTIVYSNNFNNWSNLKELAYLNTSNQTLMRTSYCPYNCRFDRTSSGDTRYLRNEGNESVIFEDLNPGVITRIWMTAGSGTSDPLDPNINIKFYFDGESEARVNVPLPQFFDGSTPPFIQPLTANRLVSSGGNFTYHPFPYAKSLKITLTDSIDYRIWYQINHERVNLDVTLESFKVSDSVANYESLINKTGSTLWSTTDEQLSNNIELAPSTEVEIFNRQSGGWIKELVLGLNASEFDKVRIKFSFDNRETIDLLLNEYFALGSNTGVKTQSLYLGLNAQDQLYSYFPMPFSDSASITLTAEPSLESSINIQYHVGVDNDKPTKDFGYLSTQKFDTCPTVPLIDTPFLSVSGRGKWVGIFAEYSSIGTVGRSYLEGDERVFIDWDKHPTLFGTGTEDMYNGGFYFDQGNFSMPFHGSTYHNVISPEKSETSAYRFMLADSIEFQAAIQAGLESGPFGDLPMCSKTIAYYYQANSNYELVDELDLNSKDSISNHKYKTHNSTISSELKATFLDEPPTLYTSNVNRNTKYASTFKFKNDDNFTNLRIKRLIDNHLPNQVVDVFVNGELQGAFSYVPEKPIAYVPANPDRRWVEESLELKTKSDNELEVVIVPRYKKSETENQVFTESKYQLFGIKQKEIEVDSLIDDDSLSTCSSNPNDCSLRGAIKYSKTSTSPVQIKIKPEGKIELINGPLLIEKNTSIYGLGQSMSILDMKSIGRHFRIISDSTLTLENLSLTNSEKKDGTGGIDLSSGNLNLNKVAIDGGQHLIGGNIFINQGEVNISHSKILNGKSSTSGAAIHQNSGSLIIYKSNINNQIAEGEASVIEANGKIEINSSAVYLNTSNKSTFLKKSNGTLKFKNSIFSKNISLSSIVELVNTSQLNKIINSTIYNNTNESFALNLNNSDLELSHTVLANNNNIASELKNCNYQQGNFNSLGYNLVQKAGTCADKLSPNDLKPNSETELPLSISELNLTVFPSGYKIYSNSPLIDSGVVFLEDENNTCAAVDINDSIRAINGSNKETNNCDIGAVEFVDIIYRGGFELQK